MGRGKGGKEEEDRGEGGWGGEEWAGGEGEEEMNERD